MKLKIVKHDHNFYFETIGETQKFVDEDCFLECSICHSSISNCYGYIIRKLEENELLTENFKPLCCICNYLKLKREKITNDNCIKKYKPEWL